MKKYGVIHALRRSAELCQSSGGQVLAPTSNNSVLVCYDMLGCPGHGNWSSIWCVDVFDIVRRKPQKHDDDVIAVAPHLTILSCTCTMTTRLHSKNTDERHEKDSRLLSSSMHE